MEAEMSLSIKQTIKVLEEPNLFDLWLCSVPRMGPVNYRRVWELIHNQKISRLDFLFALTQKDPLITSMLSSQQMKNLQHHLVHIDKIQRLYTYLMKKSIHYHNSHKKLQNFNLLPLLPHSNQPYYFPFCILGGLHKKPELTIAIVGSRTPSLELREKCLTLIHKQNANKLTIISGLANGIDRIAHTCAIENGFDTVGFLPAGILSYPQYLFKGCLPALKEQRSAIISLFHPYEPFSKWTALHRNKGIVDASQVIYAFGPRNNSGTAHTILYALSQKKIVFISPASTTDNDQRFYYQLLRKGARPLSL